jgi:hypothetical protein
MPYVDAALLVYTHNQWPQIIKNTPSVNASLGVPVMKKSLKDFIWKCSFGWRIQNSKPLKQRLFFIIYSKSIQWSFIGKLKKHQQ